MLSPIDTLLAIEEIKQVKARYCRFLDSHDRVGFRSVFADDAVFGSPDNPEAEKNWKGAVPWVHWKHPQVVGGDEIATWIIDSLGDGTSVHRSYNPEIEILTADTARGIWGQEDIVRFSGMVSHGHGYYRETYVRVDGTWRIKAYEVLRKSVELRHLHTTSEAIV